MSHRTLPSWHPRAWRAVGTLLLLAAAAMCAIPVNAQTAPVLVSAASRKVHGVAGTFNLSLVLTADNPTTEPRLGPSQTIVFTFNKAVVSGNAEVMEGVAVAGTPTFSGTADQMLKNRPISAAPDGRETRSLAPVAHL